MTTIDEQAGIDLEADKPLQSAELRILDAHHWGTGPVMQHLEAMKLFAIPALELCNRDWMKMGQGATA